MWVFILTIQWLSIGTMAYQFITIRRLRRHLGEAHWLAHNATQIAAIFIERKIPIPCDDCGNMMIPGDAVDIITKPDGSTYVGHRSHNRRTDWGAH